MLISEYQISRIVSVILFYLLYKYIGIRGDWIFFYCGILIPIINVFIFKYQIYKDFPLEIYLYIIYVFLGIFFSLNAVVVYAGLGYLVPRVFFYFKAKDK